jgi:hypothetical protein
LGYSDNSGTVVARLTGQTNKIRRVGRRDGTWACQQIALFRR